MEPDLSRIRRKLTGRYVVISAFILLVFGLAVFPEVSRARKHCCANTCNNWLQRLHPRCR